MMSQMEIGAMSLYEASRSFLHCDIPEVSMDTELENDELRHPAEEIPLGGKSSLNCAFDFF